MRIMIVGYSGAGKSTLAKLLADYYNVPLLYLDKVQFLDNWQDRNEEEALKIIKDFLNNKEWIIDGNYSRRYFKERADLADKIIFLNFNRLNCLFRVLKRNKIYKGKVRDSITNGCIEKLDLEFIKWILYEGRKRSRKEKYNYLKENYQEKFIEIKNQKQLDKYINSII